MNKSDLNSSMLFKMRGYGLCVLLNKKIEGTYVFCDKETILKDGKGCLSGLNSYDETIFFKNIYDEEFDIIAIKQYNSCSEVLYMVLNNKEPEEWDWVEEIKEINIEKTENSTPTVYNMTFNFTIDPKTNIDDLVKELKDKMHKTIFF
jgi:hypothetical protein